MSPASHSDQGLPRADEPLKPVPDQKTVLLSEAAEYSPPEPRLSALPTLNASLSAAALAALSQRYDILAEAGHGSMGNVYKARDRETGETVALKLLKSEIASDQAMMDRFKNELLFARKITHKNICRVHEFNRIGGIAYTSMEFVNGESLRSVLNRFGSLPPRKAIDLVGQICSGLNEAHAQGIVHRDLKPENIMIDAQGNVKIMDFGIARSMEAVTRLTGSMVGTPAYMAPEQVAGKPVDYRTDIYSLGLIMYEVFTGAPAFQADNAVAVALKQMREAPTPPHEIEPTVPVGIERAILKCLEKEPSKRFQSIGELETAMRSAGAPPAGKNSPAIAPNYSFPTPLQSQLLHPPAAEPKRTSPVTWVLLGALLVVGAFAGWHSMQVIQAAENLPPPAAFPPPAPPDFALDVTVPRPAVTQPAAAEPAAPEPADAKADADKPADANPETPAPVKQEPTTEAAAREPAPPKNKTSAVEAAPRNTQRQADKAYGESEPVTAPPVNDNTPSYLWVGRFQQEEKAQNTAKKIEDLGLPVVVVPRHGLTGEFYVVLTGPYGPERIESAMDWLKTQGFADVRLIKNPLGNPRQAPN